MTREASAIMKRLNNQKGQDLVELALVLPILLLLALGITEVGMAWYYNNALDAGVRAGVRYASELYPVPTANDSRIQAYVQNEINTYPTSIGGSVTVTVTPPASKTGNLVTVTASYLYTFLPSNFLFNYFNIPTSMTLGRTGTMYYEPGTT